MVMMIMFIIGGGGVLDDFGEKKVPSGEDAGKVVYFLTI